MILEILWKRRYLILTISILSITLSLLSILPLDYFGLIIDGINDSTMSFSEIKNKILIMLLIAILFYILQGINETLIFYGYSTYQNYFQEIILKKVLKQNPEFLQKISVGEIMSRITGDAEEYIASFFGWGHYTFVKGVLEVIIITIFIYFKSNLTFVFLISIPYIIVTILIVAMKRKFTNKFEKMTKSADEMSEKILESIKGIRIIRSYNLFSKINTKFEKKVLKYANDNLEFVKLHIYSHAYNILAVGFSYFVLILYGYYQYVNNMMSIGTLVSLSLIMYLLPWPYTMLSSFIISIFETRLGIKRINDILKVEDKTLINENGLKLNFSKNIEFKNFSFAYDDKKVLDDISLIINKGETVGIIGKTGSGKTTFIKQLLRFFSKTKNIYIDGIEIEKYNLASLRSNFGYTPQEYYIFSDTIKENILFNRNLEDKLEDAIEISDLKKDIKTFVNGIDTIVGENGISLSGGQKQRLSIARAIIGNPEILIFDDSLSALDINTEKNIIKRINEYRKGKTNIIVSHRISSVINANKIIILENGKISNIGTHNQLLEESSWYKELYEYQNKEEL